MLQSGCHEPGTDEQTDPALLKALRAPATYGGSCPVIAHETHASWVFIAGEYAYKIKKPVALGFLDYGTLSRRHAACREEVRVNEELAPGIYLGVLAIVKEGDVFGFAAEGSPHAVEYAVQMRSFSESDTMEASIAAGSLTAAEVQRVGGCLACFHQSAPIVQSAEPEDVLESWLVNVREMCALQYADRWPTDLAFHFGEAFVQANHLEIERRARQGHVRDGHGDLRCEHVLLKPEIRVVDRIEFDPALRRIDVTADLAFLTMDLEAHGQTWAAQELVRAYTNAGGEVGSQALLSFYAAQRALVRAKVTLLEAAEHQPADRGNRYERAEALWALSERLCWRARRPVAIVVCGPPASGKSTLAAELAQRCALPVASSDVVRKGLAGLALTERARPEHYSPEFTEVTYLHLAGQALGHLRAEGGVIVDATCHSPEQRKILLDELDVAGVTWLVVYCHLDAKVALDRAERRMGDPERASDATPEIVAQQVSRFEPPLELPAQSVLSLDTELSLEAQVWEVTYALDERLLQRS